MWDFEWDKTHPVGPPLFVWAKNWKGVLLLEHKRAVLNECKKEVATWDFDTSKIPFDSRLYSWAKNGKVQVILNGTMV